MGIKLVLVRHGESSFNSMGLIQGRTDDSILTKKGYKQAARAGEALSKIYFDKIYSSPLKRAAETANTIKKSLRKEQDIIYDNNLLEVDLSSWSGFKIDQIKNKYPEIFSVWENDPENLKLKRNDDSDYQPIQELFEQAKFFIKHILKNYLEKNDTNILVIGHNGILVCLILLLIGEPKRGFRKISLENASFSILNISKHNNSFKTQIVCLNQTSHLNQKIPKKIGNSRLFLINPGETNWNKEGRFQGQIDISLNKNGKDQANKISELLKEVNFKRAFSSTLDRTYKTAQIILQKNKDLKIIKLDSLSEINHGLWEEKLGKEIKKDWPNLLKKWNHKPKEVKMPEGESIRDVSDISIKAFEEICSTQKNDDSILLVAHDAVNKTLICNILGIGFSNICMIKQVDGGVTVIDIFDDPNKDSVISALNITSNLGEIIDSTTLGSI